MELDSDSRVDKENGSLLRFQNAAKGHIEVPVTPKHLTRTPLADVKNKNKHGQETTGLFGSSKKKHSVGSSIRLDILTPYATPKRQERHAKSRKSCFAAFHIPQDLDECVDRTVGTTFSRAIEEEPFITVQNQVLSGDILEFTKEITTLTADHNLHEGFTESHVGTGVLKGTVRDEETNEGDDSHVTGHSRNDSADNASVHGVPLADSSNIISSEADCEAAAPKTDHCSQAKPGQVDSEGPGLLRPSLMLVAEAEADKLVEILVEECAVGLSKNLNATANDSEGPPKDALQCPFDGVTIERSSMAHVEPIADTVSDQVNHSKSLSSKTPADIPESPLSTPKSACNESKHQSFMTPQAQVSSSSSSSSPLSELANISGPSFTEGLRNAELSDLIKAYLLSNSTSISGEISASVPAKSHLLALDLSPVPAEQSKAISDFKDSSSYETCTDAVTVPRSPVIHMDMKHDEEVDRVKVHCEHSGNAHVSKCEESKTEASEGFISGDVNSLGNGCILTGEEVENCMKPGQSTVVSSHCSQSSESQVNFQADSDVNVRVNVVSLPHEVQSWSCEMQNLSLEVESSYCEVQNLPREVQGLLYEVQNTETYLKSDSEDVVCSPVNAAASNEDLQFQNSDKSAFTDCPEIAEESRKSVSEQMEVSLTAGQLQSDMASAAASTCAGEEAGVADHECLSVSSPVIACAVSSIHASMVTNSYPGGSISLINRASMITDVCRDKDTPVLTDVCHGIDVSTVTDSYRGIDTSMVIDVCRDKDTPMLTDVCHGIDVSTVTDSYRGIDTSMMTDAFLGTDASMVTDVCCDKDTPMLSDVCHGIDVSTVTDSYHGIDTSMMTDAFLGTDASMVTDACHCIDVSLVTDTCPGIDVSLVTDSTSTCDHSIMAVPEYQGQGTMTERDTLVDAESSMTPLKLGKQARRLTAEDVRRQHPRIVANQIETLMMSNQRLEKDVSIIAHDRDRLRLVLKETKSKLATANRQLQEEREQREQAVSSAEQKYHKAVQELQARVADKQVRVDSLERELVEVRQKYKETQENFTSSRLEWQERHDQLEKRHLEAEKRFDEEVRKLQAQLEERSYCHQFMAFQQVIRKQQAEIEEFTGLLDDLERSAMLQSRLQSSVRQLITASQKSIRDHANKWEQLSKENKNLHQQFVSVQTDLEVAVSENRDLHEDILNMNDILQRSNGSLVELESAYQAVKEELLQSKAQVVELTSRIVCGTKVVEDLIRAKKELTQQLSEYQERESLARKDLNSAVEDIMRLEEQLEKERQLAAAIKEEYEQVISENETSKSKLELCIENLQGTLDSWEVDRDLLQQEVTQCKEQIMRRQAKMEEMSEELSMLHKNSASTKLEKDYIQDLRNINQFLEAEKQLYIDAITEYRTKLEAELKQTASSAALVDALRSSNGELQQSCNQLMSDVQVLEEILSMKTMDLDMSCAALENMQEKMESVLVSLQQKCGQEVKYTSPRRDEAKKFITPKKQFSSSCEGSSFVSQVLSVAGGEPSLTASLSHQGLLRNDSSSMDYYLEHHSVRNDEMGKEKPRQSNVQFGACCPKQSLVAELSISPHNQSFGMPVQDTKPLIDSARSVSFSEHHEMLEMKLDVTWASKTPQRQVKKGDTNRSYQEQELATSSPGFAKVCSIPSVMERTLASMSKVRGDKSTSVLSCSPDDTSQSSSEPDSLLAKVKAVDRLFHLILKTVDMAERASELTRRDLIEDISLLKEKLKHQRCQTSDLETKLSQKSVQLSSATSQIKDLNARISGMTRSLLNFQDQEDQILRLEEEKTDLNHKIQDLRGEVTLLSGQLEETIQRLEDVSNGQNQEGASVREIINYKKKNHELMMKLFKERDKNKDVGDRAMRRIKILESNWQKAEAEVRRFDDLVEQIRETCVRSQAQLTHPAVLHVVRLIDGQQDKSSLEKVDKTPVKSLLSS